MRLPAFACLGLLALCAGGERAHAAGAPAGTQIDNTAQVSYDLGAASLTTSSNTVSLRVAEVLDVVVTVQTPSVSVSPGTGNQALLFRVTNTGNGPETFRLGMLSAIGGDDFDPVPAASAIYFDTDASGTLTPADVPYAPGVNDPALAADGFVSLLVLNGIPAALPNAARGLSRLTAEARTGTGAPGTVFAGAGEASTDAVVGTSGADGEGTGEYLVADLALSAVKSATVSDPFGGARPVPGAQVVYQIVVTPSGTGTATGAVVTDPIPLRTRFVPGSLRLNGAPLSDAADADAGSYLAAPAPSVRVALGNLTQASGPQTVAFAVTIE